MKYRGVSAIFIFMCFLVMAQNKKTTISFEYYTHDFGVLKEDGGVVTYEFGFQNAGNVSLVINNVVASCGCTVPTWSKEPVPPGEKGVVKVEFNPLNKPGPFNKTITVYSNSYNDAVILNITGKVLPKPRKPTDDFPDAMGNLRMVSRYMNMGTLSTKEAAQKDFAIYNHADTAIVIDKMVYNQNFMYVSIENNQIPAKSKSKITITYDPAKRYDFGYVQDKIELKTSDAGSVYKTLFVTSYITKYFDNISSDDPVIKCNKHWHDFGKIKQGEKMTTNFTLKNTGKNELIIYKVKPSCGCTTIDIDKKILKQNEEAVLDVTFDSGGKDGMQEKIINIYTNDPSNHNVILTLKAKIEKTTTGTQP
ncbi:MAG: DUF1573 domain-containing protein [Cytophagales bacterium]|nr:DUF1573 domain-containing protein [Cytophagales bacterium]